MQLSCSGIIVRGNKGLKSLLHANSAGGGDYSGGESGIREHGCLTFADCSHSYNVVRKPLVGHAIVLIYPDFIDSFDALDRLGL